MEQRHKSNVWAAFKQLAAHYPDCGAVKLTIELQRAFIAQQLRGFDHAVGAMLDLHGGREALLSRTPAMPNTLFGAANDPIE